MLSAVIFDMDGVIIDSHPAHRAAWRTFLREIGKNVTEAELDFVLDGRKRSEILRHFLGELSEDEIREYGDRKDEFFKKAALNVEVIPGVLELIASLHDGGIPTAVATSASESRCRHVLAQVRLADKFSVIVTGNEVSHGKPDPAIYRLACQRLGVPPRQALAVEDAISGIRAAKLAGLTCIGVTGHQSPELLRQAGASHVIQNFLGLSIGDLRALAGPTLPHPAPSPRALIVS
jgi:HAD superfamily hydrolase (TIGR01509 family)